MIIVEIVKKAKSLKMINIEDVKKTKSKEIHTLCVNHEMVHFFIVIILNKSIKKRLI
jgi:hypothetical protein